MNDTKMRASAGNVLEVRGLRKSYGSLIALDGIDLTVPKGEIFGLLGHNGAGKTTTIECALGTKKADGGTVAVLGLDPARDRETLFARVGVQFQHTGFQDKLRVGEACEITASLYRESRDWRELLERFSLLEKRASFVSELSGGERQKLAVAIALIHGPELLFLDELTTGLDPASRRYVWDYLKALKEDGVSIVLTSHYMDEVEYLCDRVAILRKGSIVMEGTPEDLVAEHNAKNLEDVFLKEAM